MVDMTEVKRRAAIHAALGEPVRLAAVDALMLGDAAPGELGEALGIPSNLLAHHLRVLEEAGVIRRTRSAADRRRWYVRLVPEALTMPAPAAWTRPVSAFRVVFVCTRNSARSQLAAALWGRRSQVPVTSAGTDPGPGVHARAIATARRHGLVLGRRTRHVAQVVRPDDLVVAVCDNAYEELGRQPALHWSVPDPVRIDTDEAFEDAFTEIWSRVERLSLSVDAGTPHPGRTGATTGAGTAEVPHP
jgi:ArsR family transcriptional regulator, arsenate/arsenite/antimonite-responsive transcriptional repressor / arsenate reductase (thioredoxin)